MDADEAKKRQKKQGEKEKNLPFKKQEFVSSKKGDADKEKKAAQKDNKKKQAESGTSVF